MAISPSFTIRALRKRLVAVVKRQRLNRKLDGEVLVLDRIEGSRFLLTLARCLTNVPASKLSFTEPEDSLLRR